MRSAAVALLATLLAGCSETEPGGADSANLESRGPVAPAAPAENSDLVHGEPAPVEEPPASRPAPDSEPAAASACLMQDGERLSVAPLRAVGTEPFWAARIEGRCVTYMTPDDQDGTRIWTRYTAAAGGGATWAGALGGRRFELRTRPAPGCSDGMSDERYPLEAELVVLGEERRGCAERL